MPCVLLIFAVLGGVVVGWLSIAVVTNRLVTVQNAQEVCPNCSYSESGRDRTLPCPECGLNREDAARAQHGSPWPAVLPFVPAIIASALFLALTPNDQMLRRPLAVGCAMAAPLYIALMVITTEFHKLAKPAMFAACLSVLAITVSCTFLFTRQSAPVALKPGMETYTPDLILMLNPPIAAAVTTASLGWMLALIALVLRWRAGPDYGMVARSASPDAP